jgi:hypothetical protein
MPSTFLSVQQSTLDVKAGNSEGTTQVVTTSVATDRIERLAPSVRDGESVGVIERKAAWMARAYGIEYSDALEEMVWFLWRRPDLLGEEYSDGWLANRCVYHVRSQMSRQRARACVRMDDEEGAIHERAIHERAIHESPLRDVADLLDELAPQVQALAAAILENEDTVHQSSGRANVACLARRLKVRPETVRARMGKLANVIRNA